MGALAQTIAKKARRVRETKIIINGREKTVDGREATFNQLIGLAYDNPPTGEFICYTIMYRKGRAHKREGSVIEGEPVKLKKGMIFDVSYTDKS